MLIITLDGGLVQEISSDDPSLTGKEITILDYDIDGAEEEYLVDTTYFSGGIHRQAYYTSIFMQPLSEEKAEQLKNIIK